MKFVIVFLFACLMVSLASARAQFFGGFQSLQGGFGGGLDAPLQAARDPRQNRGPVVFPPAPPDNGETSGVVVGASGFGFVPPSQSKTSSVNGKKGRIRYRLCYHESCQWGAPFWTWNSF